MGTPIPEIGMIQPDFVALDVETANPDFSSICQIGLVFFKDAKVIANCENLIDPEDYFDSWNVSIHGITHEMVKDAPNFAQISNSLRGYLNNQIVVHHTNFDKASLSQVCEKYELEFFNCSWLDSARVARITWDECRHAGYGLADLAEMLDIEFKHHDAVEDARAAGEVLLHALMVSGKSIQDWLTLAYRKPSDNQKFAQAGNVEGPLYGETIVFTGSLSLTRFEAAKTAADAGCNVADGVNKHTTLLVVGNQDIRRLAGSEKSAKHRKAEELIQQGKSIRIICEKDFLKLIKI
jgi:DNA polymerase-3 subunit epsilon